MEARSLESIQARGTVWSIGARQAATLDTTVALVAGGQTLIPPGQYRMSSWYKKRGEWSLLIFTQGKNYASGTPYIEVPLRHQQTAEATLMLRMKLSASPGAVELSVLAGRSQLALVLMPLAVQRNPAVVLGHPATYEFYSWPATPDIQARIRAFHPIVFGRLRHSMPFGAVYDLTCRSDGKGVFIDAKSHSLRDNQRLLDEAQRRQPGPGEASEHAARLKHLSAAVTLQKTMQPNVMIAADTLTQRARMPHLRVTPLRNQAPSDSPPPAGDAPRDPPGIRGFTLDYGQRRVTFHITDPSFLKLRWR